MKWDLYSENETMEKQDSFAVTYGIDPVEYAEDEIESANFSVRTFGRLKNNGIDTVADLLRETEVDLLSIKGFGRNSCDEVIEFVKTLRQSVNVFSEISIIKWIESSSRGMKQKNVWIM